jgi:glycosyltransferase involved in cell wall biosynthesis
MSARPPTASAQQGPFDVILIAPNVSEQMGGEAIKALQICLELAAQGARVHQITHERARTELETSFPQISASFVPDTHLEKALYRGKLFELLLNYIFLRAASKKAQALLQTSPNAVVHFTSPVSPILPYPRIPGAVVVIGPNNGNIHYPAAFRQREGFAYKLRRWLHPFMQFLHRLGPSGKRRADAILVAGGERTYESLRMAGCRDAQFVDSIDSGVLTRLYEAPRIEHQGINLRFFHNGRLVKHKGTDLILKALAQTKLPVEMDIIGRGPELTALRALCTSLSLDDRVNFIEWVADHTELTRMMRTYRAFVFPSLAEANGIVVQEAMMQGLPVIALDWGGPQLLVTAETGILLQPSAEPAVIAGLATAMDLLAGDGELAESMSIHGRERAIRHGFLWRDIIQTWRSLYARLAASRGI